MLDAVIELFSEHNLNPGVHEVADRSGVSLRSVYRYFEDLDELISSAISRQFELARPRLVIEGLGHGPVDERIETFATRRVDLFEHVRVVYKAATIRAGSDELIRDGLARVRARLAQQAHDMFAGELETMPPERARHVDLTLDLVTQFEALERLRGERGLTAEETVDHLRVCLHKLLD